MHIYAQICVYIYYICGLCNIFWYHNMTLYKYQVPAMIVRAVLLQRSSRVTRIPWHSPLHPSRLLCCRSWCHLAQDWAKTSINGLDFKDSIRFRWVRSLQCDTLWNNFKHSDNFKHGLIMSRLTSKCEITISWLHHASLHFWKAIGTVSGVGGPRNGLMMFLWGSSPQPKTRTELGASTQTELVFPCFFAHLIEHELTIPCSP